MEILHCFLYVLRRIGSELWAGDGPDYPKVVFDAIKDNPAYSRHLQRLGPSDNKAWFLHWFSDYLQSVWEFPIFDEMFAKMVDFLCEELQHERFQGARPKIMVAATVVSVFTPTTSRGSNTCFSLFGPS